MSPRTAFAWLAVALLTASLCGTAAAQHATRGPDADAGATTAVQACIDRINDARVGLSDLEQRCPDLPIALQAAGIWPLLIDSSRTLFDGTSLRELPNMIHPAFGPVPSVVALGPILRGLHPASVVPPSWWRRLLDWLIAQLTPKQDSNSAASWLTGLLRLLPKMQWLWTAIIWGTCIALPICVVVIVLREVRAMGGRSIDDPVTADETAAAGQVESRLALLRRAPLPQRPAQLFALLITRLVAAGRLPPDRSLTHREVARRADLDDLEQRRVIESLARLSERQLYSGSTSIPVGLDELLAHGEDLYTTGWGRPAEP
jgi:hypothetical protein